jgi:K(+)-stimulated pyrophosphate-energized sodium pump
LIALASFAVIFLSLGRSYPGIWGALIAGLVAGNIIGYSTEHYTSENYAPTRNLSGQSGTGPATLIIEGLSLGMASTLIPILSVVFATLVAFFLSGGLDHPGLGLYGIGLSAVGMLSTLGITLATDAYGPVADNAGGIAEMSGLSPTVRERTDALDALGNTTAATGKGFAIGSAALTALALLAEYGHKIKEAIESLFNYRTIPTHIELIDTGLLHVTRGYHGIIQGIQMSIDLLDPRILVGLFLGGVLPFVFSAFSMRAVGRAAGEMVNEVRRQFKEKPDIMKGTEKPDYAACVAISTKSAQKEMVAPSLLAITAPLLVGIVLGPFTVIAMLAAALASGFVLAIMMANSGGAWDNAKKFIEKGAHGGKGSSAHAAAVVGDTVGDPMKDTSGPAINILLKLMSMVAIVFVPVCLALNELVLTIF